MLIGGPDSSNISLQAAVLASQDSTIDIPHSLRFIQFVVCYQSVKSHRLNFRGRSSIWDGGDDDKVVVDLRHPIMLVVNCCIRNAITKIQFQGNAPPEDRGRLVIFGLYDANIWNPGYRIMLVPSIFDIIWEDLR